MKKVKCKECGQEVEEPKKLEEQFADNVKKTVAFRLGAEPEDLIHNLWKEHAQIAINNSLRVFDEAVENNDLPSIYKNTNMLAIRKALENQ